MNGKLVSIKVQRAKIVTLDWATTVLGFVVFNFLRYNILNVAAYGQTMREYLLSDTLLAEVVSIPLLVLGIFWLSGYYNHPFGKSRLAEFSTTVFSSLVNTLWIYLALLINDQIYGRSISYELIFSLFFCLFIFTYSGRLMLSRRALKHFRARKWSFNTVIVGDSHKAMDVCDKLLKTQKSLGYNVLAFLPIDGEISSRRPHPTLNMEQLSRMCADKRIENVLIIPDKNDETSLLQLIYQLLPLGVPLRLAPTALSILSRNIRLHDVYAEPFVDISSPGISDFTQNLKRMLDVMVSAVALLVLAPFFAAVALAVKSSSRGKVIYSQERIGYHQKPFRIYKFRSMVENAEADGPRLSDDEDPRITPVGHFMRKYRIDELPQFWNVLRGDMSLVGPRPERAYFIEQIVKKAPYYTLLHQVRPGLTSWGMVKFGYAKTVDEMVERARYDMVYLANMSISMDLKIIIHTVNTVFSGKGV